MTVNNFFGDLSSCWSYLTGIVQSFFTNIFYNSEYIFLKYFVYFLLSVSVFGFGIELILTFLLSFKSQKLVLFNFFYLKSLKFNEVSSYSFYNPNVKSTLTGSVLRSSEVRSFSNFLKTSESRNFTTSSLRDFKLPSFNSYSIKYQGSYKLNNINLYNLRDFNPKLKGTHYVN